MLYVSGATNRMGKIAHHNTTSDFDKEVQKREFSISIALEFTKPDFSEPAIGCPSIKFSSISSAITSL